MNLTPQQERKLKKLSNLVEKGDIAILEHLIEVEDKFDTTIKEIKDTVEPNLQNILEQIKGEDGVQGIKGDKGDKGDKGEKGLNGKNGIDGKNGEDGVNGLDGLNGINGLDGNIKDLSPQEIRDSLELLSGENRLGVESIKGIKIYDDEIATLQNRTQLLVQISTQRSNSSALSGTLSVGGGGTGATTLADNSILTGTGTNAITAESTLTYDGTTFIQNVNSGYIKIGVPTSTFGAIGFNSGTLALTNASLYGNGTNTYVNAPTGGIVSTRINNVQVTQVDANQLTINATDGNGIYLNSTGYAVFTFNGPSSGIFRNNTSAFFIDQQSSDPIYLRTNGGGTYALTLTSAGKAGFHDVTGPTAFIETEGTTEQLRLRYNSTNYLSTTVASTGSTTFALTGTTPTFTFSQDVSAPRLISTNVVRLKGYTVATLPAGTQGDTAFVTDALAPAFLVAVAGGGAVVTTVFYNGAAWVAQ